jgi:hypothetical protein
VNISRILALLDYCWTFFGGSGTEAKGYRSFTVEARVAMDGGVRRAMDHSFWVSLGGEAWEPDKYGWP